MASLRYKRRMLTLRAGVHDNLREHAKQEELAETQSEAKASPVVSVLHDFEAVAIEIDVAVKVHFVESLHRDLFPAMVLDLVRLLLEVEVVLDRATWVSGLAILARGHGRGEDPKAHKNRDAREQAEEDGRLSAAADLP